MHTDPNQNSTGPEHIQNPEVSFEKRDLGARGILLFFAILFISGAAIHLVAWGLYKAFSNVSEAHQPPANPLVPGRQQAPPPGVLQNAGSVNIRQFPEPRLQTDEASDVKRFLWQENQLLEAKPWRDQAGAIHIPLTEAMRIVAQKGLPMRQGLQQETAPQPAGK
jgi:hypothetical protein